MFERLDENFDIRTGITVPSGDHHYNEYGFEFNTDRSRVLSGNLRFYDGDFWDGEKRSFQVGGAISAQWSSQHRIQLQSR